MEEGFALWANPSSPHAEGRKARNALEDARARIKTALGWEGELIFTSGASEAAALALGAGQIERRIVTSVEHDAIHSGAGARIDAVLALKDGRSFNRGDTYDALGVIGTSTDDMRPPSMLCMQHVNSETGAILPVSGIRGVMSNFSEALMLCDCSQSAGKIALPSGSVFPDTDDGMRTPDMIIVSAHKLGGPIGIGALLVKDFNLLKPTGGHERGYRRGTENMPAALGFAAALEAGDWQTSSRERESFFAGFGDARMPFDEQVDYIAALTHPTMSAQAQLIRLDAAGFAVSAGSACSSGTLKQSRVLKAFGVDDATASRTIRVSLGWNTTAEELDRFADAWSSLT